LFLTSPILWLRDVAAYLNLKLTYEAPPTAAASESTDEAEDCLGEAPLSALSQNMRKLILAMLQNCSAALRETFIETCIANTAHELAKGFSHVVGWRILTQAGLPMQKISAQKAFYYRYRVPYRYKYHKTSFKEGFVTLLIMGNFALQLVPVSPIETILTYSTGMYWCDPWYSNKTKHTTGLPILTRTGTGTGILFNSMGPPL
jgi:hypothetical protein